MMKLQGHEAAVWAVQMMPEHGLMLTGVCVALCTTQYFGYAIKCLNNYYTWILSICNTL